MVESKIEQMQHLGVASAHEPFPNLHFTKTRTLQKQKDEASHLLLLWLAGHRDIERNELADILLLQP